MFINTVWLTMWFYVLITIVICSIAGLSFRDAGRKGAVALFSVISLVVSVMFAIAFPY